MGDANKADIKSPSENRWGIVWSDRHHYSVLWYNIPIKTGGL
jgi:hypothetical protein